MNLFSILSQFHGMCNFIFKSVLWIVIMAITIRIHTVAIIAYVGEIGLGAYNFKDN